MSVLLLDTIDAPSGRELVSQRPAWRVRLDSGQETWAFVELRGTQLLVTGYPTNPVQQLATRNGAAGAVVGFGTGAIVGSAFWGPPGALVGGIIGAILAASGSSERK